MIRPDPKTAAADCPVFLVGTRFQAVMANAIRRQLDLPVFDLVCFFKRDVSIVVEDRAFGSLLVEARNLTLIDRSASMPSQLHKIIAAIGGEPRRVFLAQINNEFILSVFLWRRRLLMSTFDEGSYNVLTEGPFFCPPKRSLWNVRDLLKRLLFPRGPFAFARRRSQHHYTIFPTRLNLMSSSATRVRVNWADYMEPDEVVLARAARRILVMPCLTDFSGSSSDRLLLVATAASCDIVARHPRDGVIPDVKSQKFKSPIEAIVSVALKSAPVQVFHYNSTVGLTLAGWPRLTITDLHSGASGGSGIERFPGNIDAQG